MKKYAGARESKQKVSRSPQQPQPFKGIQSNSKEFKDQIQRATSSHAEKTTPASSKQTSPTTSYRPKGKIASLPEEQRELINQMLSEGSTYAVVCQKLRERGVSLNAENVSNWHNGAHQDWLLHQQWREDTRTLREAALDLTAGSDPSRFNQAALQLASIQIFSALRHLPRGPLEQKLGGDSASFARLVNALSRATRETLHAQKYLDACAQARAALSPINDPKRKLSESETRAIVRAVDRVLGLNFEDEPEDALAGEEATVDSPQPTGEGSEPTVHDTVDVVHAVDGPESPLKGPESRGHSTQSPCATPESNSQFIQDPRAS